MELEPALANLQAEAKCQICLGEMIDPVTIECGHNFCSICITQSWADLEGRLPCPVCRCQCKASPLMSNLQLRRIIARANQLHSQLSKTQEEKPLCEKHGLALNLFCEEDLELLCVLCTWLPSHQGHRARPIEVAASQHRERLRSYIQSLNRQVAEFQNALDSQGRKQSRLPEKMERKRRELCFESQYLKQLVDQQQQAVLLMFDKEEREMDQKCHRRRTQLAKHISALGGLLREASKKSMMPDVALLMCIKRIFHRCEQVTPPAFSLPLDYSLVNIREQVYGVPPHFSTLQTIRQKFREEITLDPETACPHLLVYADKKSVRCVNGEPSDPGNPARSMGFAVVLGSQRFSSGRHYWEVRVDDKPAWAVGLCKDTLAADRATRPLSRRRSRWVIQRQDGVYVVEHTVRSTLELTNKPSMIGIYLDYELGEIFFYNLNDKTHIHSFRDKFSEVLRPYFYVGDDCKPLFVQ